MLPIVYVDGHLADRLGKIGLQKVADEISKLAQEPVCVMTHGHSRYHAERRILSKREG